MGLDSQTSRCIKVLSRCPTIVPPDVLERAVGLCVITEVKGAALFSAMVGRGLLVKRLSKYKWGFPSSVMTFGIGWGLQIGGEKVDHIIVINDKATMETLECSLQVRLGGELSVSLGPRGKDAKAFAALGAGHAASCFTYSFAKGAFIGASFDGAFLSHNKFVNKEFYGGNFDVRAILNGIIQLDGMALTTVPELHQALYDIQHGQVGAGRVVLPLDDEEFQLAEQARGNYVSRRDTYLSASQKKAMQKHASSAKSNGTIYDSCDDDDDVYHFQDAVEPEVGRSTNPFDDPVYRKTQYHVDLERVQMICDHDEQWFQKRVETGPAVVFKSPHIVDENLLENAEHFIINAKEGTVAILIDGDLATGLPPPYSEYVMVHIPHQDRVGRVSRFCLEPYSQDPGFKFTSL